MKSWADHCSSDEESFNEDTPMDAFEDDDDDDHQPNERHKEEPAGIEEGMNDMHVNDHKKSTNHHHHHNDHPPKPRTYEFPSEPPYTLFVGNVSYSIKDSRSLGDALADLVKDRLQKDIHVGRCKLIGGGGGRNRGDQTHKGFGYVEVESVEEMKIVLELNMDPGAQLAGRKVQLDTATQNQKQGYNNTNNNKDGFRGSRRGSAGEVDGRQFRGGKYNQQNNNQDRRNSSNQKESGPPPDRSQRPSLLLKPRSKPLDETTGGSSASNIFGGAKARDENAWHPNKEKRGSTSNAPVATGGPEEPHDASEAVAPAPEGKPADINGGSGGPVQKDRRTSGRGGGRGRGRGRGRGGDHHDDQDDNSNNNNRRGSNFGGGRGGRGGGRGGRHNDNKGRGRGRGDNPKKDRRESDRKNKAQPAPAPAVPPAAVKEEKKAEKKRAVNTFAALAFDSDSD